MLALVVALSVGSLRMLLTIAVQALGGDFYYSSGIHLTRVITDQLFGGLQVAGHAFLNAAALTRLQGSRVLLFAAFALIVQIMEACEKASGSCRTKCAQALALA
jgi:hypothetical protein